MQLTWIRGVFVWLTLMGSCCANAAAVEVWRFVKTVQTPALGREEVVAVILDPEVYAATRADLADLRLRDRHGREVPYLLEKRFRTRTEPVDRQVVATTVALKELAQNRIEVIMDLAEGTAAPAFLALDTPLRDFEKRISVYGRRHGGSWTQLVEHHPVFDYSRHMDVRNVRVPLPGIRYDTYRIEIDNVTDVTESAFVELARERQSDGTTLDSVQTVLQRRNFRIDQIRFYARVAQTRERQEMEVPYTVRIETVDRDANRGQTEILLRAARQPLCGFRLETPSRNFNRAVQVHVRAVQGGIERWVEIGSGRIRNLSFRTVSEEHLTVGFPQRRQDEYRLLIMDHDNPPLEITGLEGVGKVYQLVFLAEPDREYRLHFGNDRAPAPVYDAASVLGTLRAAQHGQLRKLELGSAEPDTATERGFSLHSLLSSRLFLGLVVAVGVLVLLGAIRFALHRVDSLAPPGPDAD